MSGSTNTRRSRSRPHPRRLAPYNPWARDEQRRNLTNFIRDSSNETRKQEILPGHVSRVAERQRPFASLRWFTSFHFTSLLLDESRPVRLFQLTPPQPLANDPLMARCGGGNGSVIAK